MPLLTMAGLTNRSQYIGTVQRPGVTTYRSQRRDQQHHCLVGDLHEKACLEMFCLNGSAGDLAEPHKKPEAPSWLIEDLTCLVRR